MKTNLASILRLAAGASCIGVSAAFAGISLPEATRQTSPKYPLAQRLAGREAAVLVHYHVTPAGTTKEVSVVSSTDRSFENAALDAVRRWTYLPARKDGVAVDCPAIQLVLFHLPENDAVTVRARLVDQLQSRLHRPNGVEHLVQSNDACICGSGDAYNNCHRGS